MFKDCQYPSKLMGIYPQLCAGSCYIYQESMMFTSAQSRAAYYEQKYFQKMIILDQKTKSSPNTKTEILLSSGNDKIKLTFSEVF